MSADATLIVHRQAIRANSAFFAERTGGRLLAVVKADGFGHGDKAVATAALEGGASWLGAATLDEALRLRAGAPLTPILCWRHGPDTAFDVAIAHRIDVAPASTSVLAAVVDAARVTGRRARVHLHADIGMARDGCPPEAWPALVAATIEAARADLVEVVGIMGHEAGSAAAGAGPASSSPSHGHDDAFARFIRAIGTARAAGLRPPITHLQATASTLERGSDGFALHRIGAGLYGIDPGAALTAVAGGDVRTPTRRTSLQPTMSLVAPVIDVRRVARGTAVGYAGEHVTDRATTLALLPVAYGDGVPRSASHRAEVLLRGRRKRLVGRFSMDTVIVDVGDDAVARGDAVTIFGPVAAGAPTAREWASWAGTIEHEHLCGIGSRTPRVARTVAE